MLPTKFGQATDVGLLRTNNEDAILSKPSIGLWLVADGMGGHEAGEVASHIVQESIGFAVASGQPLASAVLDAHKDILNAADNGNGKFGMGSTVVALTSNDVGYQIAWVGDSRAYVINSYGVLTQLSTDHSYVQSLYKSGLISFEEMAHHPDRNIITQCLGSTEQDDVYVDTVEHKWQTKDRVMLCSDGLTDYVSESDVRTLLQANNEPQAAVDALIQAALKAGGKDNISVIVVDAPENIGHSWFQRLKSKLLRR